MAAGSIVLPLALAQFIASYAGSNMNVAISTIADDIGTTVIGMQTAITLFTLTMASLMIPGSKLSDIWGRKVCFMAGLAIYGSGALIASLSQGLGLMIFGYSLLEGVGSALMIPPIYILITVVYPSTRERAKYFGIVSGAAGLGAAAGPLIGGLITSAISWRASFVLQVLVVALIIVLARKIVDPPRECGTAVRPRRGDPLRRRPVLRGARHPAELDVRLDRRPHGLQHRRHRRHPEGRHLPGLAVRGHRRRVPRLVLPAHPRRRSAPARTRCCHRGCSATGRPTSGWSPRTSSG